MIGRDFSEQVGIIDVGAEIDGCRRVDMAPAVARQEHHAHAFERSRHERVARRAGALPAPAAVDAPAR